MPANSSAAAKIVDAQKQILELQAEVDRRKAYRPRPSFVPLETADSFELRARFAARYAELHALAVGEVRGMAQFRDADDLVDTLAGMRAMQLLRQEVDPNWREQQQRYDADERDRRRRERLVRANFPAIVVDALMTGQDERGNAMGETDALVWMRGAWAAGRRLVVLCGAVGTGKTFAACTVCADEHDKLYACARELYRLSDRREEDREAMLDWAESCAVLLCDQVGDAEERQEDSARLSGLWQRRFDRKLRTVAIANLTRTQLEEKYSAAVSSRLFEAGALHTCGEIVREGEKKRQKRLAKRVAK